MASTSTWRPTGTFPPYEAIIRKAQRISADLLVVENHHGTGRHPARWLLAYTDWELLRLCPIPVLLVKNRQLYHRPRVLAAIDPSHAYAKPSNLDRQILRAGAQLVHALHGELHALHAFIPGVPVVPAMPDGPMLDVAAGRDELEREARRKLERAVDGFDVKRSHCHLVQGRPNEVDPAHRQARTQRHRRDGRGVALGSQALLHWQHGGVRHGRRVGGHPGGEASRFRVTRAALGTRRSDPVDADPAGLSCSFTQYRESAHR